MSSKIRLSTVRYGLLSLSILLILLLLADLVETEPLVLNQPAAAAPADSVSPPARSPEPLSPVQITAQETITNLDVMVIFDVSGSTEYETNCYDCWVRTNVNDHRYPSNGYFNPLPYNLVWADLNDDGNPTNDGVNQSIPDSDLCTAAVSAPLDDNGQMYLSHEAELYSRNVGNWNLNARTPGQGFWAIQRGSRSDNEIDSYNPYHTDPDDDWQGNQAGNPDNQSSSVCNPAAGGIECTIGTDNICDSADGTAATVDDNHPTGFPVDCSAYIKAHPFPTYSQGEFNLPQLQGAAYDITCWSGTPGCWDSNGLVDDTRPHQSQVPYVEYDFTPQWSGQTHVWIRALGGGQRAYQWNGASPTTLQSWQTSIIWQVYQGTATNLVQDVTTQDSGVQSATDWRDNRAENDRWRWVKLGAIDTTVDVQHTLRLYQASAGYKVDKIYFTENSDDFPVQSFLNNNNGKGPPATNGSATREACNVCNPAYGYQVDVGDCGCPVNAAEAQAYRSTGAYGSGNACTNVNKETSMLENDLYSGLQPLRSTQEAVKDFANRLDTNLDQLGLIAFTTDTISEDARGTPLQCQRADPGNCENNENRFIQVLRAVENQWSQAGTNVSKGLKEGLMALGVEPFTKSTCDPTDPTSNCSRSGARKVLILITDGTPNARAGSYCRPGNNDPDTGEAILDMWERADPTGNDANYECAVHYAKEAADRGVSLYTIGIGPGINSDFLTLLAEGRDPHYPDGPETVWFSARCGRFFNAVTPDDLEAIFTAIETDVRLCGIQAATDITLTGPTTGTLQTDYTYTATISPLTATHPLSYVWRATGQTSLTQTNGLTDTARFTWTTPGTKTITVTATNAAGSVSDELTTRITASPKERGNTYLPVILKSAAR